MLLTKRGQILLVCIFGKLNAGLCHTSVSGGSKRCKNAAVPPASLTSHCVCVCVCVGVCVLVYALKCLTCQLLPTRHILKDVIAKYVTSRYFSLISLTLLHLFCCCSIFQRLVLVRNCNTEFNWD